MDKDYSYVETKLTIPAGQPSGTISINLVETDRKEGEEAFVLVLINPINATFGGGFPEFIGQGTITDIDGPPPFPTLSFTTTDFNVAEEVDGGKFHH